MRTVHEQVKSNPRLSDAAFAAVQAQLRTLPWLDQVLGRAWKVTKDTTSGKKVTHPCVYTHGNEYEDVAPSGDLGNYSYFLLGDPESMDGYGRMRYAASLIVWCDLRRCFATDPGNRRDTETLKAQVLEAIGGVSYEGSIAVTKVYEDPKNVFAGLTITEEDARLTEQPYMAMRFDLAILAPAPCGTIQQ